MLTVGLRAYPERTPLIVRTYNRASSARIVETQEKSLLRAMLVCCRIIE